MTKFEIFVSTTASKELNKPESKIKERIKRKVREISADPYNLKGLLDIKKLARSLTYRIMNSSMTWYIIYIIAAFILALILGIAFY